ncbi:unnamed protein product [Nyctereutes procyonoides]|uniref:COX assembly mitochondrial protein n=1 Tax=Nyctereutes procyonoides TaxID=34880 RepID=A0A811YT26_NYCPR|nr:unnamed protein product [Nyctereutes procyonoides]
MRQTSSAYFLLWNNKPSLNTQICEVDAIVCPLFPVILLLKRKQNWHSILKFFGLCNDLDWEMRKCLKNKYMEKRTKSREHGNAMQKRL